MSESDLAALNPTQDEYAAFTECFRALERLGWEVYIADLDDSDGELILRLERSRNRKTLPVNQPSGGRSRALHSLKSNRYDRR